MQRDLTELYSELGLSADCSLDELKLAYRRRIAKLHPDHAPHPGDDGTPLAELARLYDSAMRFHRRHGRLPGGLAAHRPGERTSSRSPVAATPAGQSPPITAPGTAARLPVAVLVLPLVALLVLILLSRDWLSPARAPEPDRPLPPKLAAGMDEASALAIQGQPLLVRDGRWHYGPSWLQFERGRLVDWRSDPVFPLKTSTATPAQTQPGQ